MPLPLQTPPALEAPAPASSQQAELALLDAYDWDQALPAAPGLKGKAALDYRWLRLAASFDPKQGLPMHPFAAGAARAEAEGLRHLGQLPAERLPKALQALPLKHSGTALALWRWGQQRVQQGAFTPPVRQAWENRLLSAGPSLLRGYALRHALCWALAERDEARFTDLRTRTQGGGAEAILKGFQRLFGLLDSPSPELRLWSLPDLSYADRRLDQLGAGRVWICPAPTGALPPAPAGAAWIIPSSIGSTEDREATLVGEALSEAQALAERLQAAGQRAQLAPSRAAFERLGLYWFPILIELDAAGAVKSLRMGDAAPERP